jgi:hypothetical protein
MKEPHLLGRWPRWAVRHRVPMLQFYVHYMSTLWMKLVP